MMRSSLYFKSRTFIFLLTVLVLIPTWFVYIFISNHIMENSYSADEIQKQLLSWKLHLIDQKQREPLFHDLLKLIHEVDIHRRKEILKGTEMLKWFRRLMISEQSQFLDAILPQSLTRAMKDFSEMPYDRQLEQIHKSIIGLKKSDKVSDIVKNGIEKVPEDFQVFKERLMEDWAKQTPHQIHGLILEKVFLRLNSGDTQANTYDMAKAMMYEDAITEAKGPFDEADVNS
jgi:hypothetical protein